MQAPLPSAVTIGGSPTVGGSPTTRMRSLIPTGAPFTPVSSTSGALRRHHSLAASPEDPYCPIEKRPLITHDGMRSKGFTVRLQDDRFPSGYREVGVVSADYLLVPNTDVRDLALEIAERSGGAWTLTREVFDGKRYAYALALRDHSLVDVRLGDPVGLGLLFENSYDGSRRLSASLYVNRLACMNGMLVPSVFRRVSFKHTDAAREWEMGIASALRMIEQAGPLLSRFASAMTQLSALRVTTDELARIRASVLPQLPVTLFGKVVDRFLAHEEATGWGLLNAATRVLWHSAKPTVSDMAHNEYVVRAMADYVSVGGSLAGSVGGSLDNAIGGGVR